jgi:hypothetical protein
MHMVIDGAFWIAAAILPVAFWLAGHFSAGSCAAGVTIVLASFAISYLAFRRRIFTFFTFLQGVPILALCLELAWHAATRI